MARNFRFFGVFICLFAISFQQTVSQNDELEKNTTTTPKPTESPTTPEVTTQNHTTTPTTTPKTTKVPVTTSAPVTTVKPPALETGTWNVTYDNGTICILAKMAVQFDIQGTIINLPSIADNKGSSCTPPADNTTQILVLEHEEYKLTLTFVKNGSAVYVKEINFVDGEDSYQNVNDHFKVPNGYSFQCSAQENVKMDMGNVSTNVTINFSNVQVQAFMSNDKFSTVEQCYADSNNLVPIVVACALVLMIVIILIGYLITRRRSHQRGYQSV